MFEIVDSQATGPIIKVIGVGGAGGNAVNHMIDQGVEGVEFIAVNTDAQVLSRNKARNQLQLGSSGLGAGAKPEEARAVAIADRDRIDRGFRRLKPDLRAVLVVHHYLGLTYDEAAEVLGVPAGTVKSRLNRATVALRAELDAEARGRAPVATETIR